MSKERVRETLSEKQLSEMVELLYQQLRQRARSVRSRLPHCATMDSRALIHEAYAKMAQGNHQFHSETHFLATASTAMRHVMIDYVRQKNAGKRDDDGVEPALLIPEQEQERLLEIDKALTRFEQHYEREHKVAVYRIFGGMTLEETALAVGVSLATVKRDWAFAQAWLYKQIAS
ncbi:RNA polymerase, sigma-24 subunit, ECF subfamily [Ferrimonas balearica DSM 9799]|uniref:RNA polymerase, sigma-24 subunit, ECF subfamily n=1 Tax=Ferrimonas balearica (strain DSM 9799 / CCM 4581 / KCTC 23876 / PAT) TaxID=550540 RepID=E1SSK5_FERBD|nr:ECF-type sigma factor [Ferrimonas balearica]ADN76034.1 RNA polymerase, sigma-24 subunit, ECF subfamily [Ferrimonas balearica DSM 9799]MBY5979726.1 sigma-70 family RNA polymerase sigma factor [Ferrimonas balearica]